MDERADADDLYVSVALVEPATIRTLNRTYRGKDRATNVLSFPGDLAPLTPRSRLRDLGEIVVCPAVCVDEAHQHDMDPELRLAHLLVHGVLHLCGHEHEADAEAATRMQAREREMLADITESQYRALRPCVEPGKSQ